MIRDLDETIAAFLSGEARPGSLLATARIDFAPPSLEWRTRLQPGLTLNCFLYDTRENRDLRRPDTIVTYNADRTRAARRRPPARIDCRYCLTAWAVTAEELNPVLSEHRLLSDTLRVLLSRRSIPDRYWVGSVADQLPPFPVLEAEPDALKNQPDFWVAFNQQPRPSLTYTATLAMSLDDSEPDGHIVGPDEDDVSIDVDHLRPE